jgi:hypothetical protein
MRKSIFSVVAACLLAGSLLIEHPALAAERAKTEIKQESGRVAETMNSAGYTYMLVESGKGQQWVAIPETTVKKGQEVQYHPGMMMQNFTSKTLNRTFPVIVFSDGLTGAQPSPETTKKEKPTADNSSDFAAAVQAEQKNSTAGDLPKDHPTMGGNMNMGVSGGSGGAIVPLQDIHVDKATGSNSYTIGDLYAKADKLNGQKVRVRGKVVKVSMSIMGRNWVHIQDGSGDPMQNTHDLVITTQETQADGSVVMMEGILAAKKDFGAGYSYAAIIEQAISVTE